MATPNPRKQHGVYINDSELRARIAELEAELNNEDYETLRLRLERAEAERDDYKAVAIDAAKDQARLTAELATLKARRCETCARPCDTYDESNYAGDEPFYCARWAGKGTA